MEIKRNLAKEHNTRNAFQNKWLRLKTTSQIMNIQVVYLMQERPIHVSLEVLIAPFNLASPLCDVCVTLFRNVD